MTKQASDFTSNPHKELTVDTLVVGAGFAGILAAANQAKKGKKVLVVETANSVGGRWSPEKRDGFQFGICIACSDASAWENIYSKLEISYEKQIIENGGALLSTTKGWEKVDSLPYWENYLAQPISLLPKGGLGGFLETILEQKNFDLSLECPVSEIFIENGQATSAIAGDTLIHFKDCLWAADAKTLMDVLRGDAIPEAGTARIAWMKQFILHPSTPGVVLEFAHSERTSDFTETLFLPLPTPEEEKNQRYLVGAFSSNRDQTLAPNSKQVSSWLFSVPEEIYEDNHEIMKRIRSARRSLEKCFPGFEKSIAFERVQVLPQTITPLKSSRGKKNPSVTNTSEQQGIFPNLIPVADWAAPAGAHFSGIVENILGA